MKRAEPHLFHTSGLLINSSCLFKGTSACLPMPQAPYRHLGFVYQHLFGLDNLVDTFALFPKLLNIFIFV
jgi:hypothetical protein